MAIGNADFTEKEKKGFAWFFNVENDWAIMEPHVILYLKKLGEQWRLQKNESSQTFKIDLASVIADLKDDPTQMGAVKTVLEI
jgi:hypothetical protein